MFLAQLWMPVVASAVAVFVLSSLVHMVFKWHNRDYRGFANEEQVRAAIRASTPEPGLYLTPYVSDMKDCAKPEVLQRFIDGPIAFITVRPSGAPKLGAPLIQWFVFTLVVGAIAAYVAACSLGREASWGQVARLTSAIAFMGYFGGSVQSSIWFGKPWASTGRDLLDAVMYAAATGSIFAWLWPR